MIQRVVAGLRYAISGVGPDNWFGPSQPAAPQAQAQAEGRAFDYPVGYNLRTRPRDGESITFEQLRALADGYDLLRLVIETRKASTSLLQRKLRVGYARAARIIEEMEEQGIIGPADGSRPRDVLIHSLDELDSDGDNDSI